MGLVSMISDNPPAMGWIYVDKNTMELRYGNKSASINHIVGPWDMTDDDKGVTLEGQEAFVAVEEQDNEFAVYYDRKMDGQSLPKGKRILQISIERQPKPKPRPS